MNSTLHTLARFTRVKQDFICQQCGHSVSGSGYTNHCPKCLYSRHVDVNPGDRAAECHGLMEPRELILKHNKYRIRHRCLKCGFERMQNCAADDDFEALMTLSS